MSSSLLEWGWQRMIMDFSDFQLATFGTFLVHESAFFLFGIPLLCLERSGFLSQYKIQKKTNSASAQWRCTIKIIMYHVFLNLPLSLVSYQNFRSMGIKSTLPLPPWAVVITQLVLYVVLEDLFVYCAHRMLHTKWLYEHVHSVHHKYTTPFGFAAEYAHPVEISLNSFGFALGPALTSPHLFTFWLWIFLRVAQTFEIHCGYEFPWSPSKFLPLYGGAEFHDFHHRMPPNRSGNYGEIFTVLDRLLGTDKDYRKKKARGSENGKEL